MKQGIQKRKANGENGAKRRGEKEEEKRERERMKRSMEAEAARAEYDVDPLHKTDTGYTWDTGGRAAV